MITKPKQASPVPAKTTAAKSLTAAKKAATPRALAGTKATKVPAPVVVALAVKAEIAKAPKATGPAAVASVSKPAESLKKKDLIERVLTVTGGKKKIVRDIVEATLTVLGDALSKGEMLNLPPFGKAKVSRPSDTASGRPMTVKLRRGPGGGQRGPKAKQGLADIDD